MLYKPQFCCQCGEKIDRAAWHFWTSRKFCEICETDFPIARRASLILAATTLGGVIFGFGAFLKTGERRSAAADANRNASIVAGKNAGNQKNAQLAAPDAVQNNGAIQNAQVQAKQTSSAGENPSDPSRAKNLRLVKGENSQTGAEKTVYYCGAQTKKGSPCTRRVKVLNKRCWQHEGLPAIVPAEKLAAPQ